MKEANSNKLRLVLNNQKRLETQLEAAKLDNEALAASKAKDDSSASGNCSLHGQE